MNYGDGMSLLQNATKKLKTSWQASEDGWNDQVRDRFESEHLEPLIADIKRAVTAMGIMSEFIARMKQECS